MQYGKLENGEVIYYQKPENILCEDPTSRGYKEVITLAGESSKITETETQIILTGNTSSFSQPEKSRTIMAAMTIGINKKTFFMVCILRLEHSIRKDIKIIYISTLLFFLFLHFLFVHLQY